MPQYELLDSRDLIGQWQVDFTKAVAESWATKVAMFVSSDLGTEHYNWLGQSPALKARGGQSAATQLKQFAYSLTNQEYEAAIEFTSADVRRDKKGDIQNRIGSLAKRAALHYQKMLVDILNTNGNGYDAVAFIGTGHPESGTSQKNLLTSSEVGAADVATATAPTATEMSSVLISTIGYMKSLVDDQGEPINQDAKEFTILCPTAPIYNAVYGAIHKDRLASGEANVLFGSDLKLTPVMETRLTSATDKVFVLRTDDNVKPLIVQEEVAPQIEVLGLGSEFEKLNKRQIFKVFTSRAAGYGLWQYASRVTLS